MKKSAIYQRTYIVILIIILGINISCSEDLIEPEPVQEVNLKFESKKFIQDQYIVLLSKHPAKNDKMAEAALEALSKEVGSMQGARIKGTFKNSVTGFVAKLTTQQVEKLKKDPRVSSITVDRYIEMENFSTTNMATIYEYPHWGLDRIDQRAENLDRTFVSTSNGTGVNVYVMDSGIRETHEEFEGRVNLGIDMEFEINPENVDPGQVPGYDCGGHGTPVAGLIGGKNYGVAKNVNMISIKANIKCENLFPMSYLIGGIDWLTHHALENNKLPAVVNMSLGAIYHSDFDPLEHAIASSINSGINFTISAGNSNMETCDYSPARVPGALSVGASDIFNHRGSFSNYGDCLDLYSPGVSVTTAGHREDNEKRGFAGTSASAPLVAGIVALYLENNPEATPEEVHSAIVENSTPNFIKEVPYGPANLAYSLWEAVDFNPPPAPEISIKGFLSKVRGEHAINIQWTTPEELSHIVYRDGIPVARYDRAETSYLEYTQLKNATIVYKVCGVAYENCSRELTVVIGNGGDISEPTSSPPLAYFTHSANWLNVQFQDKSSDGDGSIVAWNWNFGDGNSSNIQNPAHNYSQTGKYRVELTVTDNDGFTGTSWKDIWVNSQELEPKNIILSAYGSKVKGEWKTDLFWDPVGDSERIEIYRNDSLFQTVENAGSYIDQTNFKGGGSLTYKICEAGTSTCSNEVTVNF